MATSIVVDASVLVATAIPDDPGHRSALGLVDRCIREHMPFIEPAVMIPEVLGAITRMTGRPRLARRLLDAYRERADFSVVPVEIAVAESAGDIAALQRLRGCDAIYLALARELALPLITLDREQRERAPEDVEVLTPEQALAEWFGVRSTLS